jgi:hypothetical protein
MSSSERLAALNRDVARIESAIEQLKNPDVGTRLDEKVQEHMKQFDVSYATALLTIRKSDPELAKEYCASFGVQKTATRS